jgi:hypothetical protein
MWKKVCRRVHTSVGVSLGAVAVLQSVGPSAIVLGRRSQRLADTVTAFESLRPLATVNPAAARLDAQAVPFSILPVPLVRAPSLITNKITVTND